MNWRNYQDLLDDIRIKLIPQLPKNISKVYGVPRSGMLPAYIVANHFSIPAGMAGTEALSGDRVLKRDGQGPILLIDDSLYRGGSMKAAQQAMGFTPDIKAVVYAQQANVDMVDFFADKVEGPRVFEWNLFDCGITEKTMFDIDGVVCFDPPMFDDDGEKYQYYLRNATPFLIPKRKVHSFCTSRLDRWRTITHAWMVDNDIRYENLYMHPATTADERRRMGNQNKLKAERYRESNAQLFVESHDHHADMIARISKKPVISIESKQLFRG